MRVPTGPAQAEIVVSRSKFLGLLFPVTGQSQARELLKMLKHQHGDATHVVHAFCLGEGNTRTLGCSDDGEPPGTAGRPVLDVLAGCGGGDAFLAVVRWYGGTNLGTGGLVKAYSETAKAVLAVAGWKVLRDLVTVTATIAYDQLRPLRTFLLAADAEGITEVFAETVTVTASVPREKLARLQTDTADLSRGMAEWTSLSKPS
jgi:uncharacterized YigZ family protein